MKEYIYKVILEDGRAYFHYDYEHAYEVYERDGIRMYAVTKDLFPVSTLMYNKASKTLAFCII